VRREAAPHEDLAQVACALKKEKNMRYMPVLSVTSVPAIPVSDEVLALMRKSLIDDEPSATLELERRFEQVLEDRR